MKKVISISIIIAVLSMVLVSCNKGGMFVIRGEGDAVTTTIDMGQFDMVELAGEFDVEVTYGDEHKVEIVGQQNITDRLTLDNNNGHLKLKLKRGTYRDFELKIYITVPNIKEVGISGSGDIIINRFENLNDLDLDLSGSGNIISTDTIFVESLVFDISGSGNIDFTTITQKTATTVSGSGNVELYGTTIVQQISISGSGNFECFDFISNRTDINISGSGDCEVYANDFLDVEIYGSGSVYYKGYPEIDINITGSGGVHNSN